LNDVATSLYQVIDRALFAEINAKLQLQAMVLSDVKYHSGNEAQLASDVNDGQIQRSWNFWKERIGSID
jgi:hypothetical protein